MAGGQERILRRRIRTVESTKKITRPWSSSRHRRSCAPRDASPARARTSRASPTILAETASESGRRRRGCVGVPESPRNVARARHRRGPGPGGRLQLERAPRRGAADPLPATAKGQDLPGDGRRARRHRPTSGSATSPVERQFAGMSDRPSFEDAAAGGRGDRAAVPRRRGRPRRRSSRPGSCSAGSQVVESASCSQSCRQRALPSAGRLRLDFMAAEAGVTAGRGRANHRPPAPAATARLLRVRARRRGAAATARPAVRRGLDLRRAA